MDSNSTTPVIYSYGSKARDACWTELSKSISKFASLQHHESLFINSNGEDTTVINEKNCMMTPLLPFKSTIKSPPPVIRRSQHKYTNVYASLTIDKNKDILLELWSKSNSSPGLKGEKNNHSTVMSVMISSNTLKDRLLFEHCRRRKLFMDSPSSIAIDYSLLPAENAIKLNANIAKKYDINEDNNIKSPQSSLQLLLYYNSKNDCFINALNNEKNVFTEVDNIIEYYCKLFLGIFVFTVLLRTLFV